MLGIDGCRNVDSVEDGKYMVFDHLSEEYGNRFKQLFSLIKKQNEEIAQVKGTIDTLMGRLPPKA